MIFTCGPTWEEEKRQRGEWRDFFTILPRVIAVVDGYEKCAWLQTIQRRSEFVSSMYDCWWRHEYRLKPLDAAGESSK